MVGEVKLKPLKLPTPKLKNISHPDDWEVAGIHVTLKDLKDTGVVIPITFSSSSLVWPMQKPRILEWPDSSPDCGHCARRGVFLEQINTASGTCYVTIDLTHTFFSILIRKEDQKQFAFTWNRRHNTVTIWSRAMLPLLLLVMLMIYSYNPMISELSRHPTVNRIDSLHI